MIWKRRDRPALFQDFPMIADETWDQCKTGQRPASEVVPVVAAEKAETAPYWVSISRKTGFRRLHKVNECRVQPEFG